MTDPVPVAPAEVDRLRATVAALLPVARLYVDAFRDDERMSLTERLALQQIEDILDEWTQADD